MIIYLAPNWLIKNEETLIAEDRHKEETCLEEVSLTYNSVCKAGQD